MADLRVLVSPEGDRIAQSIPEGERQWEYGYRWLCMSFPAGRGLTANLFTDEDVADWREVELHA